MAEKMTLKDVGDFHKRVLTSLKRVKGMGYEREQHQGMSDAIDAHLAQPAQAVDVGAIREVIKRLEEHPLSDEWKVFDQCADKLTHAISGKPL